MYASLSSLETRSMDASWFEHNYTNAG
jgi:hypothetical protein